MGEGGVIVHSFACFNSTRNEHAEPDLHHNFSDAVRPYRLYSEI